MLYNKNAYDQTTFETFFKTTDIYLALNEKYTLINFEKDYAPFVFNHHERFKEGWLRSQPVWWEKHETFRSILEQKGIVDAVPFYYLQYITDTNPEKIYDIGCGSNFFKSYIPNLIGISGDQPSNPFFAGDEHGWIDDNYIAQHQHFFPSAFSLVSLHFVPITQIRKRVIDFMSMIKPGGRGFLSMITYEMIADSVDPEILINHDEYIRTQLYDMPFDYLVVDIDTNNRKLLGNIRLVMQK